MCRSTEERWSGKFRAEFNDVPIVHVCYGGAVTVYEFHGRIIRSDSPEDNEKAIAKLFDDAVKQKRASH